ncbi:MAG: hypothetical protein ACFCUQ_22220 [Kiloniellales bacterium]
MPSLLIKRFGTEELPAETRLLKAGPMSVELDAGNLRYIRYQGREAIRAVSYVVRDQYWGTFNPTIDNFRVEEAGDGFAITYDALCSDGSQQFKYQARITGTADGTLLFEGKGTALTDFLTNRTGFVVLHPVEGVSGYPVTVEHVDGRIVETRFPEVIDPKQPIMDIRALTHEVAPGLEVTCTMTGDTFEMEDQRNWTDASYKTYVRPLGLPFPYTLKAGQVIEQAVKVSFAGKPAAAESSGDVPVTVRLGGREGRVPRFGMALEAGDVDATLTKSDRLTALAPAYLSGFLDLRRHDAGYAIAGFREIARSLGSALALEIVVPDDADPAEALKAVAAATEAAVARPTSVAVSWAGDLGFVMPGTVFADSGPFDRLYAVARAAFPGIALGGGSFAYFTELNRKPPPFDKLDFVCHTTCALVHAADDRSVTETIECLPYIVTSARALFGDKDYRIGPATIGTRTSPFGNEPPYNEANVRMTMTRRDPRQRGLLGAAWHLGYGARMAEGGVNAVTLGAPAGDYGLMYHSGENTQPWYDQVGGVFPAYHVMRGLYPASGAHRRATTVSRPSELQALAFETAQGTELWLGNLTGEPRGVGLEGADLNGARIAYLDDESFEACAAGPEGLEEMEAAPGSKALTLAPYAVARIRLRA